MVNDNNFYLRVQLLTDHSFSITGLKFLSWIHGKRISNKNSAHISVQTFQCNVCQEVRKSNLTEALKGILTSLKDKKLSPALAGRNRTHNLCGCLFRTIIWFQKAKSDATMFLDNNHVYDGLYFSFQLPIPVTSLWSSWDYSRCVHGSTSSLPLKLNYITHRVH